MPSWKDVNVWFEGAGERHDATEAHHMLWRAAVVKALPKPVQNKLEDVVGLGWKSTGKWRARLIHFYRRYKAEEDDKNETLKTLTKQLLKLWVSEMINLAND